MCVCVLLIYVLNKLFLDYKYIVSMILFDKYIYRGTRIPYIYMRIIYIHCYFAFANIKHNQNLIIIMRYFKFLNLYSLNCL